MTIEVSATKQQQQLHVDHDTFRAPRFNEAGNIAQRHPMHRDLLMLGAATVASFCQAGRADEGEGFGDHAGG